MLYHARAAGQPCPLHHAPEAVLTVQNGQGQDAPCAGSSHPVEEVLGGHTRGLLDGNEKLNDDQAFHAASVQAEQVVVAAVGTAMGQERVMMALWAQVP